MLPITIMIILNDLGHCSSYQNMRINLIYSSKKIRLPYSSPVIRNFANCSDTDNKAYQNAHKNEGMHKTAQARSNNNLFETCPIIILSLSFCCADSGGLI
jgi:hypothetical protein